VDVRWNLAGIGLAHAAGGGTLRNGPDLHKGRRARDIHSARFAEFSEACVARDIGLCYGASDVRKTRSAKRHTTLAPVQKKQTVAILLNVLRWTQSFTRSPLSIHPAEWAWWEFPLGLAFLITYFVNA
jgi:hypothetical protein